jgi:hypothetical protein
MIRSLALRFDVMHVVAAIVAPPLLCIFGIKVKLTLTAAPFPYHNR